jgi:uncharacterized protein YjiS (DUF1127 family)
MHTTRPTLSPSASTSPGGDLLTTIATAWRDVRTAAETRARARRDLDELSRLDDRALADMGLTRADVQAIGAGRHVVR